jgi:CRP-like cAMP-binding protein
VRKVLYLLGQLDDDDCEWLAKVGSLVRIADRTRLIEQGKRLEAVYIVIEGTLNVSTLKLGSIAKIGAGELVGEMSLVDSRPASASIDAAGPVALLKVPRDSLVAKIAEDIGFSSRIHRAIAIFLADRMRSTMEYAGDGERKPLDLDESEETLGEIDVEVLDRVHLAGARFDRVFRSLLSRSARP